MDMVVKMFTDTRRMYSLIIAICFLITTSNQDMSVSQTTRSTLNTVAVVNKQNMCGTNELFNSSKHGIIPTSFEYICVPNGEIDIAVDQFKTNNFNFKVVQAGVQDQSSFCTIFECSKNTTYIAIKNCTRGSKVMVVLDDAKHFDKNFYGGHNVRSYQLLCPTTYTLTETQTAKPFADETFVTNTAVTNIKPPTDMKIVKCGTKTETIHASIGDELCLLVKTTEPNYFVKVLNCSADDGQQGNANTKLLLWKLDGQSQDTEVFADDWSFGEDGNASSGNITFAHFYAFRFKTTNVVNFQCFIRYCSSNSNQCSKTMYKPGVRNASVQISQMVDSVLDLDDNEVVDCNAKAKERHKGWKYYHKTGKPVICNRYQQWLFKIKLCSHDIGFNMHVRYSKGHAVKGRI